VASAPSSNTSPPHPLVHDVPPGATVHTLEEERPLLEPLPLASSQGELVLEPVPTGAAVHAKDEEKPRPELLPRASSAGKLVLEPCCDAAGFTAEVFKQGVEGSGVVVLRNKYRPEVPSFSLDLSTEHGQDIMWKALASGKVVEVLNAPPCGSA
jgi:hypothetical protein